MGKSLSPAEMDCIARTALSLVESARARQIEEKGYTRERDDQYSEEQLASAAAFYLIPAFYNQDVCVGTIDSGLAVMPLLELIGENTWNGLRRVNVDVESYPDKRIGQLTTGLALGLAELERLMRMRELAGKS